MIKIQQSDRPIVWQVSREYLLPSTSGQVRWNGSSKQFEVCDNQNGMWYKIDNSVELRNDPQLAETIEWAKKKMEEEKKLDKLMSEYPSLKAAKEHLDIVYKLVQQDVSEDT
jgi:hypothetical protein